MSGYSRILNQQMLKGALSVGLAAVMFTSTQIYAQNCADKKPAVVYDAASLNKPQNATPVWDMDCTGNQDGTDQAVISNAILIVTDNSSGAKTKYCREDIFDSSCAGSQDAVYEFICRAGDVVVDAPSWSPSLVYVCGLVDGTYDFRVAISDIDGVGFWESSASDNDWLDLGNGNLVVDVDWSTFHVFRVEKDDTDIKLFVDNEANASITIALGDLPNNSRQNGATLATTSLNGQVDFELLSFRYRIGTTSFEDPGRPDCLGDLDADDDVDTADLITFLASWGPCPASPASCPADFDSDGCVGASDLLILLGNWGPC